MLEVFEMKIAVLFFVVFGVFVLCQALPSKYTYLGYVFPSKTISNIISSKLSDSVSDGIRQAMEQCSEQFKWKQWNCPKSAFSRRSFRKTSITREIAYARTLTVAGIMHSLTKHCAKSSKSLCDCEVFMSDTLQEAMLDWEDISPFNEAKPRKNQTSTISKNYDEKQFNLMVGVNQTGIENNTWSWDGCSDDTGFAEEKTRKILEDFETVKDVYSYVERQNNLLGRRVVRDSLKRKCRCHGVSGSCSHKTCWLQVDPFEVIAETLLKKYRKAVRVNPNQVYLALKVRNDSDNSGRGRMKIRPRQLVYLDESPDYCVPDANRGWPGTLGRFCSKDNSTDPEERKSCQNLCRNCGYAVDKKIIKKKRRCKCTFKMCCEVICELCDDQHEQYFCA